MKGLKIPSVSDPRGELFEFKEIERDYRQVNILTSMAGTVRGNHYHKKLREKFFVVSGAVDVELRSVHTGEITKFSCSKAEEFVVDPFFLHTLTFQVDTVILSFYSEAFDEKDPDIYTIK